MYDKDKYYQRNDLGDNDFWDLSKNTGISRPSPSYQIHKRPTPQGTVIESDTGASQAVISYKIPDKKVGFSSPDTVFEYTPENVFINKIKVTTTDKEKNIFNPSALFLRERAALLDRRGSPCDYVSFYSHSPRYSAMTRAQLNYYLWWRENIRSGKLIKTDISYIKLYVQEIVTSMEGEDVLSGLSDLIKVARTCFDNPIGKVYMARVISDFCMLHMLECPTEDIMDILPHFAFEHIADEFFFGLTDKNRHAYAPIAINHISVYNYKKSKFYDEDKKALFDKHIHGAIHMCFTNDASYKAITSNASGIFSTKLSDRKLFDGRMEFCAPSARILVSYFPISCISGAVTDAIRYSENKLRALLGIRTSLAVGELPQEITSVIDDYFVAVSHDFDGFKSSIKQKAEKKAAEEYDHLYDIPKAQLSLSNAKEIEARSWATTKKLTEAFAEIAEADPVEDGVLDVPQNAEIPPVGDGVLDVPQNAETNPVGDGVLGAPPTWGNHRDFLLICINGTEQEQRSYARSHGMSLDELADSINEIAVSVIGDIILESDGEIYRVIDDYLNLI